MMISERKNTRGRIEIIASVLLHCRQGIKKTHIMSKANIGYEQLCYYLPNLINTGLLIQAIDEGSVIYRTTEAGREYLNSYFEIMRLLSYSKYGAFESWKEEIHPKINEKVGDTQKKSLVAIFEETEV
jgi:predicted transcriptional regulator